MDIKKQVNQVEIFPREGTVKWKKRELESGGKQGKNARCGRIVLRETI